MSTRVASYDVSVTRTASDRLPLAMLSFSLGSLAQGVPFTVVALDFDRRGDGPGWIAAVALARLVPYLACSAVAGALASRLAPRQVLVGCGVCRAILAVGLWICLAVDLARPLIVLLLLALTAVGTPAYPALIRVVHDVAPAARPRLAAAAAGVESGTFWAGPALGGALVALGVPGVLAVAAGIATVSVGLAPIALGQSVGPTVHAAPAPIRRALAALLAPQLRPAMVSVIAVNVAAGALGVLLVVVARGFDHDHQRIYGLLALVEGFGATAVLAAMLGPLRLQQVPRVPLLAAFATVGVLAITSRLSVAAGACAVFGAAALASEVVASSAISETLPADLVAPAFGILDAAMVAAMLVGTAVAPGLVDLAGIRTALAVIALTAGALLFAARTSGGRQPNGCRTADSSVAVG